MDRDVTSSYISPTMSLAIYSVHVTMLYCYMTLVVWLASLAASQVDGVSGKLNTILQPCMEQWRTSDLKGHEALLKELTELTWVFISL